MVAMSDGVTEITLRQIKPAGFKSVDLRSLRDAEEGEKFGCFKVTNISKLECEHEYRSWELIENNTPGEIPTAIGTCCICGITEEYYLNQKE
jgi:hypothetical protein